MDTFASHDKRRLILLLTLPACKRGRGINSQPYSQKSPRRDAVRCGEGTGLSVSKSLFVHFYFGFP